MRGRFLKPSFFKNADLAACHPLARILFEGLWCHSDARGRFKWKPKTIKAEILPHDDLSKWKVTMNLLLGQLVITGHVLPYKGENGAWYGFIPSFREHFPKEKKGSKVLPIPDPPKTFDIKSITSDLFQNVPECSGNFSLSVECLEMNIECLVVNPQTPKRGSSAKASQGQEFIPGKTKPYPELFEMVIADLNAVAGTNFKHSTALTREKITARWNEGFDLGDFRHVHRVKFAQWGSDPKRKEFVRPPTLYSRKFESYLNQKMPKDLPYSDVTAKNIKTLEKVKLT